MFDIEKIILSIPNLFSSKGTSIDEICLAERELSLNFSEDYKQYLTQFGIIAYDGHELTGIAEHSHLNVVDITKKEKKKNKSVPGDFYVIEIANIDGIIIWQKSTGEIYKTIYDSPPMLICNSLSDYIEL